MPRKAYNTFVIPLRIRQVSKPPRPRSCPRTRANAAALRGGSYGPQRGSFITSRSYERRSEARWIRAADFVCKRSRAEKCRREIEFATVRAARPSVSLTLTNRYADIIVRHPRGTSGGRGDRRMRRQIYGGVANNSDRLFARRVVSRRTELSIFWVTGYEREKERERQNRQ